MYIYINHICGLYQNARTTPKQREFLQLFQEILLMIIKRYTVVNNKMHYHSHLCLLPLKKIPHLLCTTLDLPSSPPVIAQFTSPFYIYTSIYLFLYRYIYTYIIYVHIYVYKCILHV